ncbi:hypothetical protein B0H13DRAFT_2499134 [Mycena leptocephala]|nr:hypothetical protein B0H13DRAFT_2499134 [Mycena leptocephala]
MLKPGFAIRDNTGSESEGNESWDTLLDISRHNDVWRQLEAWTGLVTQRRPNATHWVNEPVTVPANNFSVAVKSCSGVVFLGIVNTPLDPPTLQLISSLPLRRLYANLDGIIRPAGVDFRSPLFNQLTHLNIFGTEITDAWPKNLASLPCLTHLSTYWFYGANPPFRGFLAECKLLTVLVLIFIMHEHDRIVAWEDFKYFGDDPRSVLMVVRDYLGDW